MMDHIVAVGKVLETRPRQLYTIKICLADHQYACFTLPTMASELDIHCGYLRHT